MGFQFDDDGSGELVWRHVHEALAKAYGRPLILPPRIDVRPLPEGEQPRAINLNCRNCGAAPTRRAKCDYCGTLL